MESNLLKGTFTSAGAPIDPPVEPPPVELPIDDGMVYKAKDVVVLVTQDQIIVDFSATDIVDIVISRHT